MKCFRWTLNRLKNNNGLSVAGYLLSVDKLIPVIISASHIEVHPGGRCKWNSLHRPS